MKIRRLLAVMIAVLMTAAAVPFAALAEGADVPAAEAPRKTEEAPKTRGTLDSYMNYDYTYISYTNGSPGFIGKEGTFSNGTTYKYVESGNAGTNGTTASIMSEYFEMNYGESIEFQYWYDTEENYDFFRFLVNGTEELKESGTSGSWKKYTFRCQAAGEYYFEWQYKKDSSNSTGEDCVRICFVVFDRHYDESVSMAALGTTGVGDAFAYSPEPYPFNTTKNSSTAHPLFVKSSNYGVQSSVSSLVVKIWIEGASSSDPVVLSFDYAVSSEANYDKLIVRDKIGSSTTTVLTASGTDDYSWKSFSYNITSSGQHIFTFNYEKDSSTDSGEDVACIDNIVFSNPDARTRASSSYEKLNSPDSDAQLTFNTPRGSEGFICGRGSAENSYYFTANNRYSEDASVSCIETKVNMKMGENFSFRYFVSTEKNYDKLIFYANGEEMMRVSGWQEINWKSYLFIAPETRTYVFRWEYSKDSSVNRGSDIARIANVCYFGTQHNNITFQDAVSDESNVGFSIGSPENDAAAFFMPGYSPEQGYYLMSVNKYYESTAALMYINTPVVSAGTVISFKYKVSAESYELLRVKIIDLTTDYEYYQVCYNGTNSADWKTFEWTCTEETAYQILFTFEKDNTVNEYDDTAYIKDLCIKKPSSAMLGDVDGNGSVQPVDALVALRMAMEIIPSPDDLTAADVNRNGKVDANDALLILRYSMGIITSF